MKKLFLVMLMALMGLAQQVLARDVVNNTNCAVTITAVAYNTSTCAISLTCASITVPAHSTATLPGCVTISSTELLGYDICWADPVCASIACASIGNITGAHPCAQFPLGPVYLPSCGTCSASTAGVKISWDLATTAGNLIIG